MLPRSPANCALGFSPSRDSGAADVAALASELLLGVSSPKQSWVRVNDAALASGCWQAVSRSWSIRLIVADYSVRLMTAASTLSSSVPVEECRGRLISRTELSATIRRMDQLLDTAFQHPLASAESTPPQFTLGDKTPRNDEELPLGDETPGTKRTKRRASPAGESGVIYATPASLGGRNHEAQFAGKRSNIGRPSFPWGKKP